LPSGLIIKGIGGFYYVRVLDELFECKARGRFRNTNETPLPGDTVEILISDEEKKIGSIEKIHPRHSLLVRPNIANVDTIIFVVSVKLPKPDYLLLDKLLITAEAKGIRSIICVNKMDLDEENEYQKISDYYRNTEYRIIATSCVLDAGFAELKEALRDQIAVFSGMSGVGKSTILNKLMNSKIMETGVLSRKSERGKHTTRHAELIEIDTGGYIADTPGFSSFELDIIKPEKLEGYFPEFEKHLNKCKFVGCSHISEPECEIKVALEKGGITKVRYERYAELYKMLKKRKIEYK
jgi:ribosome biogenesis GTPase